MPNSTPNDYAAVNQGQVKFIAEQAMQELDAHLSGGAGPAVHALVDPWTTPMVGTNNYAAVNLGQLKALAAPFYDQLIRAGYTRQYPWSGQSAASDYAAANLGQVKNLFAFDLTSANAANDRNNNGIADWWERHFFPQGGVNPGALAVRGDGTTILQAFQRGLDPNDFYNGRPPTLKKYGGDGQSGQPGASVAAPLIVQVIGANGFPLKNAPITFLAASAGGQVQSAAGGPAVASLALRTDANGLAQTFCKLPTSPNTACQVEALVVSAKQNESGYLPKKTAPGLTPPQNAQVFFNERSVGSTGTYYSPLAPTNFVSEGNPDLSVDMTWENHNNNPVTIEIKNAQGGWDVVAVLPPGTTSYHHPGIKQP